MPSDLKRAVVLFSGGLDSTTTLAIAKSQGFLCHALTFDYRQRHQFEIKTARRITKAFGIKEHVFIKTNLGVFGKSALTTNMEVPKNRTADEISKGIPITYVPARNTIFLSFALAYAETIKAEDIFIGINVIDYSGYPDCRPEYIEAFQKMALLATKASVEKCLVYKIHTPLIEMSKADIIRKGLELGVDYSLTLSCYDPSPDGKVCGYCDSCIIRKKAFREVGIPDPAIMRFKQSRLSQSISKSNFEN